MVWIFTYLINVHGIIYIIFTLFSFVSIGTRYCDGVDAVHDFRHGLIEKILLNLLWSDYLLSRVQPSRKETMEKLDITYPMVFVQDLGKCIIEILSGIYSLETDLLLVFSSPFQENCLDLFQQKNVGSPEHIERIIKFLLLLDQNAVQKGETWPLVHLVGPLLAKSFQLIRTLVSCCSASLFKLLSWFVGHNFVINQSVDLLASKSGYANLRFLCNFRQTHV